MSARVTLVREISQPLLLKTDVRSRGNLVRRIDGGEHQDFAVARLLWVDKLERLDLVLVEIGNSAQRSLLVSNHSITSPVSRTHGEYLGLGIIRCQPVRNGMYLVYFQGDNWHVWGW